MSKAQTHPRMVRYSRLLLIPVVSLMLFVGFHQKGYDASNHLHYNSQKGGYSFRRNAIAFTESSFQFPGNGRSFTIELRVEPDYMAYPSFQFILLVHGESDADQLLIGQWDRSLVVMNGTDYSNRAHKPKLYVPLGVEGGKKDVRITSGSAGVTVYVNGKRVRHGNGMVLSAPGGPGRRLILGNSIAASNPWYGTLYDVKVFAGDEEKAGLHYDFTRRAGDTVVDQMGWGAAVHMPERIPVLNRQILLWPRLDMLRPWMVFDILINVLGFVPLGILLVLALSGKRGNLRLPLMFSFSLVVGLSLGIEVGQIYLPLRHSSLLDLLLNCVGGLVGIFIGLHYKKRQRLSSPSAVAGN